MSGKTEKNSKIPVLKSPRKKSEASADVLVEQTTSTSRRKIDGKSPSRKTPDSRSTQREHSTRNSIHIPSLAKTDVRTTNFLDDECTTEAIAQSPSHKKPMSYCEMYSKRQWTGEDTKKLKKRQSVRSKEKKVNFSFPQETVEQITFSDTDVDFELFLNINEQLEEYEREIGIAIEDYEESAIKIEEISDFQTCSAENHSCSETIEKEFDYMDPFQKFENVEASEPENVTVITDRLPPFDVDDFVDVREYEETERKILQAYESRLSSANINVENLSILKPGVLQSDSKQSHSHDVKLSKKIIEPKSEAQNLEQTPSFVKMNVNINRPNPVFEEEPQGIDDIEQPAELDCVISDPVFSVSPDESEWISKERYDARKRKEESPLCPIQNSAINLTNICTGVPTSREETSEAENDDTRGKMLESIAKGHKILDEVENSMGWMKGVVLVLCLFTFILVMIFLGWTLLYKHCGMLAPKVEPSFTESIMNWIYSWKTKF